MRRKTFYIIAAIWFVMVLIVIAASFLPIVDESTKAEVRKYMIWVVGVGAVAMVLMRRMVDNDQK